MRRVWRHYKEQPAGPFWRGDESFQTPNHPARPARWFAVPPVLLFEYQKHVTNPTPGVARKGYRFCGCAVPAFAKPAPAQFAVCHPRRGTADGLGYRFTPCNARGLMQQDLKAQWVTGLWRAVPRWVC